MRLSLLSPWSLLILPLLVAGGCRHDDEVESELKWSCVRMQGRGAPTATAECVAQLKRENSIILQHYRVVPLPAGDGGAQFALVEADRAGAVKR